MGKQIFYRGYLTSCNYACSYCPFSKRKMTKAQREKDEKALWKFVEDQKQEKEKHAVQIVPYGEALIHEYYWSALAELSQISTQEYTGCQTNFLATELPFVQAMRKCKKITDCLSGGVYVGGGHIRIEREKQKAWELIIPTKEIFSKEQRESLERKYQLQFRNYQKGNTLYRQTLVAKRRTGWTLEELEELQKEIEKIADSKGILCTFHMERGHIGITGEKADKKNGILTICREQGIALEDGAAVGDAKEDIPMLQLFSVHLFRKTKAIRSDFS